MEPRTCIRDVFVRRQPGQICEAVHEGNRTDPSHTQTVFAGTCGTVTVPLSCEFFLVYL